MSNKCIEQRTHTARRKARGQIILLILHADVRVVFSCQHVQMATSVSLC